MLKVSDGAIQASGEVGYADDGFTRDQFLEALAEMNGQDFTLTLHSVGGDVFQGQSMYNHLMAYPGKVRCVLDSLVASIATVVMCGADEIVAFKTTKVMIHNPYTLMIGDAREFRHTADVLDKLADDAADVYAEQSGKPREYWRKMMDKETYFSAEEAMEVGLVDSILETGGDKPKQAAKPVAAASSVIATPRLDAVKVQQDFRRKSQAVYHSKVVR